MNATRTRLVYPTGRIAHLWFHQSQEEARNPQSNFFFEGKSIYSYGYHFEIARLVENERGEKAVLFNCASETNTTSKHQHEVRHAVPEETEMFRIRFGRRQDFTPEFALTDYQERIKELAAKAAKAKSRKADFVSALQAVVTQANSFCRFFSLPESFEMPSEESFGVLAADILAANKAERKREKEREQARQLEAKESIERWLAGESVYLPYSITRAYLRVKGETVETSRGAEFPIRHAALGLMLVESVKASGQPYRRNEKTIHLGHYAIDSIDANGNVKAGCHHVLYEDIARIAPVLRSYIKEAK
jgi:hypothetical protein